MLHVNGETIIEGDLKVANESDSDYQVFIDMDSTSYARIQTIQQNVSFNQDLAIQPLGGNVGIGTTSPSYKLDVNGTARVTGQFDIYGGTRHTIFNFGSNNDVYIRSGESAGKVILQDGGGNVGIGETSPSYKLDVAGDINFTGTLYQNGSAFSGGSSSSKWSGSSDIYYTSGSVGIGTTSPHSTLQIQRGASLSGSALYNEDKYALILYSDDYSGGNNATSNGIFAVSHPNRSAYMTMNYQGLFKRGTGKMEIFNRTNNEIQFGTNNVERMRIDSNGRVGIGQDLLPDQKLTVKTGINYDGIKIVNENNYALFKVGRGTSSLSSYMELYDGSSSLNSKVYISSNSDSYFNGGNVGIGTTSPYYKLDIRGSGEQIINVYSNGTGNAYARFSTNNNLVTGSLMYIGTQTLNGGECFINSRYNFPIRFYQYNTHAMTIANGGNVGIGTTSPTNKLTINGSTNDTVSILGLRSGNSNTVFNAGAQIAFGYNGAATYQHFIHTRHNAVNSDNAIDFYVCNGTQTNTVTSGSIHTMSLVSGKVGIGTTNPTAPLHVYGNTYAANGIYIRTYIRPGTGSYSIGGGSSSWPSSSSISGVSIFAEHSIFSKYGYVGASDERIKENIVNVDDNLALKKVRDISCCWYNYKDKVEKGNDRVLGFIAQQVKEHLPQAVGRIKSIIPNEMRKLEDISWNSFDISGSDSSGNSISGGFNMSSDLSDCSGVKYRFYVSNDISENEIMKEVVGNQDNTFTFDQSWNNVFCYGKEVDDFHTLDKQKIFALNFSATQELDRKVIALEEENKTLKERLEALEKRLTDAGI